MVNGTREVSYSSPELCPNYRDIPLKDCAPSHLEMLQFIWIIDNIIETDGCSPRLRGSDGVRVGWCVGLEQGRRRGEGVS